ncbi:phosphonate C-P lyase system protein PhnL [Pantoea agglomerans]|jgi:alpha-D-ribose 1-methylphosphonate 5-triphosphate synthase subunit PhnL|uniref:phosphonate C-P lyase system protein PhnL n=1 Tax=Enterobacter agglomerans TaxID=549 RepID=UPI0027868A66|nr:phosphonate C-P lyase system protein PhnL [Pantoea agglomerans]MDQ0628559.1 alpha-D-ribose 1-methylphosphonate 5-triphosphate synthase subunit PhnL [Pantoea agglomerans]
MTTITPRLRVENLCKTFVLHNQNGAALPVLHNASLTAGEGECVVLHGHSGSGKSTLLRALYGNYQPDSGHIRVANQGEWIDMAQASARQIIALRRDTLGWVSQFLRVIPRVPTLEIVMQPLLERGVERALCEARAAELLTRLNVPQRLWSLAPSTFSGGEQQRVNIARGFIADYPVLLLDEPTASLDSVNSEAVVSLIEQARARGAAIVGIFHDRAVRERVADRLHLMHPIETGAQA